MLPAIARGFQLETRSWLFCLCICLIFLNRCFQGGPSIASVSFSAVSITCWSHQAPLHHHRMNQHRAGSKDIFLPFFVCQDSAPWITGWSWTCSVAEDDHEPLGFLPLSPGCHGYRDVTWSMRCRGLNPELHLCQASILPTDLHHGYPCKVRF